eukprot:TRINITY_DN59341_c0_g1_i1.p1 TRINITY_DN59341_c0_g1~~TRINITY_DN59341_c0_g1_i1.p1  ORF type:complete len:146 (-),score=15.27 TRINITY_DN59341_c0_g1_i1:224-661(-)
MIYDVYIFGRGRRCLYHEAWNQTRCCTDEAEDTKLISGLLLTLKSLTQQIGPQGPKPSSFSSYTTPRYKLHSFEVPTGYRFAMTTDPAVGDLRECLRQIYAEYFVEQVVKSPLYRVGDDVSKCGDFHTKLQTFIQTRPFFATISQ